MFFKSSSGIFVTHFNFRIFNAIPKPQKIANSNFLGFKDWQQLKSAFFLGLQVYMDVG
ncbi:MAG: hypothetical protein LBS83_03250 [Holosporales bacterium]|nr:hypothetical protein [Holosporales bacterium]